MTLVYLSSAGLVLGIVAVSSIPTAHFVAIGVVVVMGPVLAALLHI